MSNDQTRREAMIRLAKLGGAACLTAGFYGVLYDRAPVGAQNKVKTWKSHFRVKGASDKLVIAKGKNHDALVRQALAELGGLEKFISKGDVVVIKPNMSWDRPAALAANTNPNVVKTVVNMCLDAGASKVKLVDHTINDARRVFINCGMDRAAKESGAILVYPDSGLFKKMYIGGARIEEWKVYTPIIEADKLINMPVAKHHSLSRVTIGIKGWIGAVGGSRGALHQDIHQTIVDLAAFFDPTLTIVDATRIMIRNGPSGGRMSDVKEKDAIIAGVDPVAVDAAAAHLFDMNPKELPFLTIGEKTGLGKINPEPNLITRIEL